MIFEIFMRDFAPWFSVQALTGTRGLQSLLPRRIKHYAYRKCRRIRGQDGGIGHHKGEKSAALFLEQAVPVLTPAKEKVRQQGRRFKTPDEPMFTITVTDRNGVIYNGLIRKLMPLECWRLQGFTDEQFEKVRATGMSDAQLYKQAGNAVTVNVIEALGRFIKEIEEDKNERDNEI